MTQKDLDNDISQFIDIAVLQVLLRKSFNFKDIFTTSAKELIKQKFSIEDCSQKSGLSEDRVIEIMNLKIQPGEIKKDFFTFLLEDIDSICTHWGDYYRLYKEKDGVEPNEEELSIYLYKKTFDNSKFNRKSNKFYFSLNCLEAIIISIKSDSGYEEMISKARTELRIDKLMDENEKKYKKLLNNTKGKSFMD